MTTGSPERSTIRLSPDDNVLVAVTEIAAGESVREGLVARDAIPAGHKVAVRSVSKGETVLKYGQVIGVASEQIAPGQHVHTHNLVTADPSSLPRRPASSKVLTGRASAPSQFDGYRRACGRVGTRNQIGVFASVNCSATVVHAIAEKARMHLLPRYANVDGIVPIAHQTGCGMARDDLGFATLKRTMGGFLKHPNFGAVLVVGLGCEVTGSEELVSPDRDRSRYRHFDIQEVGGTTAAIDAGLREIEALLEVANRDRRSRMPASELIVGLQCGGSDGLSGVTANPAMGMAVDRLVGEGGVAILSETPEIFGAEHLLMARSVTAEVADKLLAKISWWRDHVRQNGVELDNNPSPGNKRGGVTTILEKSLGAVMKAGQTPLVDVIGYAETIAARGLVFMDSPGFDPCSATGQVASGANLLIFSTGRGSCFGCKPSPSIKLATNSEIYRRMSDDMDIDCGRIVSGMPMATVADEIFATMLEVASGRKTKSEMLNYGDHEFVPWRLGAVL